MTSTTADGRGGCFVVLDHRCDEYFADLVGSLRKFCPGSSVAWYDSGAVAPIATLYLELDVPVLPCSRVLEYAKVTTFFLDVIEWAANEDYSMVVTVETDLACLGDGFEPFLREVMNGCDYLVPRFQRHVSPQSRWRPYRSLRAERVELLRLLGTDYLNGGFSPAQVFGRRFMDRLLEAPFYDDLRAFVERNRAPGRSFSLQEILFPTLVDVLDLRVGTYPEAADRVNRYRPYHSERSVRSAATRQDVHFIHPIRRDCNHPARMFVRSLATGDEGRHG